jgi:hypothetical protein
VPQVDTELESEQRVAPGEQTPEHEPETQAWLLHAWVEPHCPALLHA